MEAQGHCDAIITIDADGQDDPRAMERMVEEYLNGCDVVYGVRADRQVDSAFKRGSAQAYYRLLRALGGEVVYNHADYRLLSARVLDALSQYGEVNLFLRGMVPLVGFRSTCVEYERLRRVADETHYPLYKMLGLAAYGITSLGIRPIRLVTALGLVISTFSFVGVIWAVVTKISGNAVDGWASMACILLLVSGIQLLSLGVIGEYVGKTYMEAKRRPRYLTSERTDDPE